MFQEICLPNHSRYERVTSLDLIEDRTVDIQKIEEETSEIFDIMRDLDRMVDDQDEDIMHIEDTVSEAHNNTEKTITELKKTNKKKKSKRWCRITTLLVGVLSIIGGIVILII